MRLRFSSKTLNLLVRSDVTCSVLVRYLSGRLQRVISKLFPVGENPGLKQMLADFKAATEAHEYSHTWFDGSIPLWFELLKPLRNSGTPVEVLEIGSWEGRSTVFLLSFLANSRVTAVDTREGGDEHQEYAGLSTNELRFDANTAQLPNRVIRKKGLSSRVLSELTVAKRESVDVVFADGSYFVDDVIVDSALSWRLLKPKLIMIFDDYLWRYERYEWGRNPSKAVNLFLRLVRGNFELLHVGQQVAIRKPISSSVYTDY
jgi:predicted O-methyltransferase YrrM